MDNSPATIAHQKQELRERFRAFRAALSSDEYVDLSTRIVTRTRKLAVVQEAHVVHVYWPLVHRREIDTTPLINWMHARGRRVVLPVVEVFGMEAEESARMKHVEWRPDEPLRPNRWGLHEPVHGAEVQSENIDVVIVPALGAGRNGHRIGHGYGYYDEFLASTPAIKIGLVYDGCLVTSIPHHEHDVALDLIVTEHEVWKPASL